MIEQSARHGTAADVHLLGDHVNLRFIDWIWHVRGNLPLAPDVSRDEAFDRLDPVFRQTGTSHEIASDTLTFRKKDQAAQDRMAIFDRGVLTFERGGGGPVLRYELVSRALLFCFLAPFFFLAVAQLTVVVADHQRASAEAEAKAGKAPKKPEKKPFKLNPIDKALGAPAPDKPKKDEDDKYPKPTAAYVLAGMFATLYGVGRILEDRLVRRLFKVRVVG